MGNANMTSKQIDNYYDVYEALPVDRSKSMTIKEIVEKTGLPRSAVRTAIKNLEIEHKIVVSEERGVTIHVRRIEKEKYEYLNAKDWIESVEAHIVWLKGRIEMYEKNLMEAEETLAKKREIVVNLAPKYETQVYM